MLSVFLLYFHINYFQFYLFTFFNLSIHFMNLLVFDTFIEFCIWGFCFCNCSKRDGFLTLTRLFTSLRRASIKATFDLTELYRNVIDCLTVSSGLAIKSHESSSMNLYSMFWMKSSLAVPSLLIMNTARKEWGSLMHEFTILISMFV